MNNIENIEFFLGDLKASNYNLSFIESVENLIKENKDLKERLENRRASYKELAIENNALLKRHKNIMNFMCANYIHKDKIKEAIENSVCSYDCLKENIEILLYGEEYFK